MGEGANDTFDVRLQPGNLRRIFQRGGAGTLYPAGIMNAGARITLLAKLRVRIPAGIEEHEENADVVFVGDGEEGVDAFLKAGGILLPQKIVKEDAHGG